MRSGRDILRDMPSGNEPTRRQIDRWSGGGARRRSDDGLCLAMTKFRDTPILECALRAGHRGDHRDVDGITWSEEEAIY
jgi:hypothetical protein